MDVQKRAKRDSWIVITVPAIVFIVCIVRIIVAARIPQTSTAVISSISQEQALDDETIYLVSGQSVDEEKGNKTRTYTRGASKGPCHSFYDSVCNVFDPIQKRSSRIGTFLELTQRNQRYAKEVLSQMSFYNVCTDILSRLDRQKFENYVDILWSSTTFYTDLPEMLKSGFPFPFSMEISKSLTTLDYSLEIDIDFGFYFHLKFPKMIHRIDECKEMERSLKTHLFEAYTLIDEESYPKNVTAYEGCTFELRELEDTHPLLFGFLKKNFYLKDNSTVQTNCQYDFYEKVLKVFYRGKDEHATKWTRTKLPSKEHARNELRVAQKPETMKKFAKCLCRYYLIQTLGPYAKNDPSTNFISVNTDKIATTLNNLKNAKQSSGFVLKNGKSDKISYDSENDLVESKCEELTKMVETSRFNVLYAEKLLLEKEVTSYRNHSKEITSLIDNIKAGVRDLLVNSPSLDDDGKKKAAAKIDNLVVRNMAEEFVSSESTEEELFVSAASLAESWLKALFNSTSKQARIKTKWPKTSYLKSRNEPRHWLNEGPLVSADTVNAWYDPSKNVITLPLAITLFPMFRGEKGVDLAFLGVIVGHELGHMTDVNGIKFDQFGNYVEDGLWTINSTILAHLSTDYGKPCGRLDYGENTLGEDMADQMGVRVLHGLFTKSISERWTQESLDRDRIMNEEFFTNYARLWCGRTTYKRECFLVSNDVHALAKHRVNKTLRQISQFSDAFSCRKGDKMYRENRALVY